MARTWNTREVLLSVVGAGLGFAAGSGLYIFMLNYGYLALVLPGAGLGFGCERMSRGVSAVRGVICALAALFGSLIVDWKFRYQNSFLEYASGIWTQVPVVMLLAFGVGLAFWWGMSGRRGEPERG